MRTFINSLNLSHLTVASRIKNLDPFADVLVRDGLPNPSGGLWHYVEIESTLTNDQINTALSIAETTEELNNITDYIASRQSLSNAYQTMINRLDQIQNAGSIPFTAAGFGQVVQAAKDEALYIERIMKVLKNLIT